MLLENLLWKTPDDHADFAKLKGTYIIPIIHYTRSCIFVTRYSYTFLEVHFLNFCQLTEAVDQISKVALHINENIRQHENFQKMLSIQNSFSREDAPKLLSHGKHGIACKLYSVLTTMNMYVQ